MYAGVFLLKATKGAGNSGPYNETPYIVVAVVAVLWFLHVNALSFFRGYVTLRWGFAQMGLHIWDTSNI